MLTLYAKPAAPLLTTEEAKLHLRVDHSDEDALIDALISAATNSLDGPDGYVGRALITQTIIQLFDCFPSAAEPLRISLPPLQEVMNIRYRDSGGTWQTMDQSEYRMISSQSRRGYVEPAVDQVWPTDVATGKGNVEVTFKAGYGDAAADVPAALVHAVRLLIGHFYENREQVVTGTIATEMPMGTTALVEPFRIYF